MYSTLKEWLVGRFNELGAYRKVASGAQIDVRLVTLDWAGLYLIEQSIKEIVDCSAFNIVGGDDLIVASIVYKYNKKGFLIRSNGTQREYEGWLASGDRALIVEDVTTTGNTLKKVVDVVLQQGASVYKIISVVDRLQGAAELLKGYDYVALLTVDDFKDTPYNYQTNV